MFSIPNNEVSRLEALQRYDILDTPPEAEFDDLALLAAQICGTPITLITLFDHDRQWFKSKIGTDLVQTPREHALCNHTIVGRDAVTVPDLRTDARFVDNPFVAGPPHLRFYAGVPLITSQGYALGTICAIDLSPRDLGPDQQRALRALARQVVCLLELRKSAKENAKLYDGAKQSALQMKHDATHDGLTGLPNRLLFGEMVAECFERSTRNPDYAFGVMFIDLDRFKRVNDSLGHAAGDQLLLTVARRLEESVRQSSDGSDSLKYTVARQSGDEFTVLMDGLTDAADATAAAEAIQLALSEPVLIDGNPVHTGGSVGIAIREASHRSAGDLLRDADAAMYHAKAGGRGRHAIFDASMHAVAVRRLGIENGLRDASRRGELLLHYQPIVSLATGDLIGFEALVRWEHNGQRVNPEEFIPIAEETGSIVSIGRWVLSEACRQLAAWTAADPALASLTISVNVSPKQFATPDLVQHVQSVLAQTRLDPARVKLEITESAIMDERYNAGQLLHELRATGVQLSMDDFGTGYSSLSCLHRFPLNELKIDRSFINNLSDRRDAAAVVQTIVQLAHNLNMRVVAEGLELPEQVAFLQSLDADCGQGYVFAKPLSVKDAERFISQRTVESIAA